MKQLLGSVRFFIFFITVILYFLTVTPFYPFLIINPYKTRKIIAKIVQNFSKFLLFFMGVKVNAKQKESLLKENYLFVSNHLTYMDAIILFAYFPSVFVTSIEIKETPFLGHLCILAGCLFVERRTKGNLSNEVKDITYALQNGLSVSIFPEGTSTDGQKVIRFRSTLYRAAILAKKPVVPVAINYTSLSGEKVNVSNHDIIFWYGDMTFLNHLWGLFLLPTIDVNIKIGAPMSIESKNHAQMATESHKWISTNYIAIV